jgi:hypothetical protein
MSIQRINSGLITGVNASALPAGSVLQVVTNSISTNGSVSGGSWQTILSASITPLNSSNKILILATAMFGNPEVGGLEMGARIYNGTSAVVQGEANSSTTRAFLGNQVPSSSSGPYNSWTPTMICSETAGTTSSKTYSVQCYGSENQAVYYNRTNSIGSEFTFSGVTTITLMEIAA